jgi:threonine-phosphate decarboxylase
MRLPHGGDIWSIARALNFDPGDILDFSASISPLGPSPEALKRLNDSLDIIHAYPDPDAVSLREALGKYLSVDAKNIAVGNGSIELLYLLPRLFKPKRALIVEPAFGEYVRSLELTGCSVESFQSMETDGFALDSEKLIERLSEAPLPDILYMANPANPTGALTPLASMERILRVCEAQGVVFVVDEAFSDFDERASVKSLSPASNALVVLRSMTKFFSLGGIRLGAMIAASDLVERVAEEITPWSVNTLAMAAGIGSLTDQDYIEGVRRWFKEESAFMSEGLASIDGLTLFDSSANFFMLKVDGPSGTVPLLRDRLLDDKILIRPLSEFTGLGKNFFRVAVRTRKDNTKLIERMKANLGELR